MAIALPNVLGHLGPRTRKVLRVVGYVVLAVVAFVFALQMTFPYDRVKAKAIEALSSKYDVVIRDVERGYMPGRVYFKDVKLTTRPAKADDKPVVFIIKELKVDLGILALLGQTASIDLDATIGPGHIAGNISLSKRSTVVDLEGSNLPGAMLPMRELMGLPISAGKIQFAVDLTLPTEKLKNGKLGSNWQKAKGKFSFECPNGCTFGDGVTKLKPKLTNARQAAFAEGGISFGKINVESMMARVDIKEGLMELTKFDTKSNDGELHVDFQLTLQPVLDDSLVAGCLRFKGSDELEKREPTTHSALTTTGAQIGPDGLFHIKLDGKFAKMGRKAQSCGPAVQGGNTNGEDFSKGPDADQPSVRPNLTVQPADDTLRGGSGSAAGAPVVPTPPPPTPVDPATTAPPSTTVPNAPPTDHDMGSDGASHNSAPGEGSAGPTPPGEPVPPGEGTAGASGAGEQPASH